MSGTVYQSDKELSNLMVDVRNCLLFYSKVKRTAKYLMAEFLVVVRNISSKGKGNF